MIYFLLRHYLLLGRASILYVKPRLLIKMDDIHVVPDGFHRVELHKTEWTVPIRYQDLKTIGSGAFGQVW